VQQLRRLRDLSQEELAERVGNGRKHISQVELGKANVGIDILAKIASHLAVDVAELFATSSARQSDYYTVSRRDFAALERALKAVQGVTRAGRRRKKSQTE